MLLMFEKGIRGGITQAVKRHAKEYNKYMNDLYNPDEVSIFLQYVDINNEYGWSVMNNLPTHWFLWKQGENFTPEKIDELPSGASKGDTWKSKWAAIFKGEEKLVEKLG